MCPEAAFQAQSRPAVQAKLAQFVSPSSGILLSACKTTPTVSPVVHNDAFKTPPQRKKRSEMEPPSDFQYSVSESTLKSQGQQCILGKTPPAMPEAEVENCFTQ